MSVICYKCRRSVEPLERLEKDKKGKLWTITYCPFERCGANLEIDATAIKKWNNLGYFEDYFT